MPIFETTSGTSADDFYETDGGLIQNAWGLSWGFSWGESWGDGGHMILFLGSSGTLPDEFFDTVADSLDTLFANTSGTSPDTIYEED